MSLRKSLYFCGAALTFCACVGADVDSDLVVKTKYGLVRGNINSEGSRQFVSVPFAAPPVGNLRFQPPKAPEPWKGEKDCTCKVCLALPKCLQSSPLTGSKPLLLPPMGPGQEDCLYLNVYTPHPLPAKPAPVALWLFGGGFQTGDADFSGMYSGAQLAQKYGLVVVAPNYRLGALGFLAHKHLSEEDGQEGVGNYGLLDQRFAMKWIQENIASFGGDPNEVTVFGQSAGAFSIAAHMVSPGSSGLFHRAVFQSSNFEGDFFYQPVQTALKFGDAWASNVGCNGSTMSQAEFLKCIRSISGKKLIEGTMYPVYPPVRPVLYPAMPWGPVMDGVFLSGYPRNLIAQGKFNHVPVIIGTQRDEGTLFLGAMALTRAGATYPANHEDDLKFLLEKFIEPKNVEEALKMYPSANYMPRCKGYLIKTHQEQCLIKWQANAILRDFFFTCASRAMARTFISQDVPVWLYQFSYDFEKAGMYNGGTNLEIANIGLGINPSRGGLGTFHMAEIPFVFGSKRAITTKLFVGNLITGGWSSGHQNMSDTMQAYWSSMIKSGSPHSADFPEWPKYDLKSDMFMQLDVPSRAQKFDIGRCDFWDSVGYGSPTTQNNDEHAVDFQADVVEFHV